MTSKIKKSVEEEKEYWFWFIALVACIIGLFILRIFYVLFWVIPYVGLSFKYLHKLNLFSLFHLFFCGQQDVFDKNDEERHDKVRSDVIKIKEVKEKRNSYSLDID